MMARTPSIRSVGGRSTRRGFVLVGVVMFILVLTILGLSLFSLSGFEAQFMQDSIDRAQCFYDATGGIERAKFAVISGSQRLENAKLNLPMDGVVYAAAKEFQPGVGFAELDSTGDVDWEGPDIVIRVLAKRNEQRKLLEGRFRPSRPTDIYRHLLTLSGPDTGFIVTTFFGDDPAFPPRYPQTQLIGDVWQNAGAVPDPDSIGTSALTYRFGGVPDPEVNRYFQERLLSAQELDDPGSSGNFTLVAPSEPTGIGFYKTTGPDAHDPRWSLYSDASNVDISVTGKVIWMLPNGGRFENVVRVHGGSGSFLVIVAGPNLGDPEEPNAGIAMLGGLQSSVPVILVSSGRVGIEHVNNVNGSSSASYLSIFARNAIFMAPFPPPPRSLTLVHPATSPPAEAEAALDLLYQLRVLPNTEGGLNGRLDLRAGTWREVTASDPSGSPD